MDIRLYLATLWRYRPLMIYGFFVALLLAFLTYARVTTHGIEARGTTTYSSTATLLITRANDFPWGRTAPSYLPSNPSKGIPSVQVADPNQLTTYALLYAQLANSDQVRAQMRREGLRHGTVTARPVFESPNPAANASSYLLPLIALTGTSVSPELAIRTTNLGTKAFLDYLKGQESAASIPANQRVSVQVIQRANDATRVSGPGKTVPIIVFLVVMMAVVALAFVLENMRRPKAKTVLLAEATGHEQRYAETQSDVRHT